MKLRIYRSYKWRNIGNGTAELFKSEELQFLNEEGVWEPVPVVESEIPEAPDYAKYVKGYYVPPTGADVERDYANIWAPDDAAKEPKLDAVKKTLKGGPCYE